MNLISSIAGRFSTDNEVPPFSPTFTPPLSVFQNPKGQLDFIFTDYLFKTAVWALNLTGEFTTTITSSQSPYLNTSDPIFISAVPELKHHPDLGITVSTSLVNISEIHISEDVGVKIDSVISLTFDIVNGTDSLFGWLLYAGVSTSLEASVVMVDSNVQLNIQTGNYSFTVQVVSSDFGRISSEDFVFLLQEAASMSGGFSYNFTVTPPQYFTYSSPFLFFQESYGDFGFNLQYSTQPAYVSCPDGTFCSSGNTCCLWNNSWECCVLPNAQCCDTGCCVEGQSCSSKYCIMAN